MVFPRWVWDYIRSSSGEGVYAEVRGWRSELVAPRYRARPSISDVTDPCPTRRSVWLRRVAGVKPSETSAVRLGRIIHALLLEPFRARHASLEALTRAFDRIMREYGVGEELVEGLRGLYEQAVVLAKASIYDGIPVAVEPRIPGAPVGLSNVVKPDLLVGFIPVEVVYGNGVERKKLALAGYALAIEATLGHPVDFGVVVRVAGPVNNPTLDWVVVTIDDGLRRRFLDARDEVARIIENGEDPGRPETCPSTCPFRGVCSLAHSGG